MRAKTSTEGSSASSQVTSGRVGSQSGRAFFVGCWNCRGLANSVPYIQALLSEKHGVLVLAEHWLWPYDLNKLNDISEEYVAHGKADSRLT